MPKKLPKVLDNDIPKNGSHLLMQVVTGIPFLTKGLWVDPWNESLSKTVPGEIRFDHISYSVKLKHFLDKNQIRRILIYRDPRDMVVSYMFHITELDKTDMHHQYFSGYLKRASPKAVRLPNNLE